MATPSTRNAGPGLVLLPGLGGDERMFDAQRRAFPNLAVPTWLAPEPGESLASFGQRMAATIRHEPPFFLGGVSFGGMVALEMANHLASAGVFLIASCRSRASLPPLARALGGLLRRLPARAYRTPRLLTPLVSRKFGKLDPAQEQLFLDMLDGAPPELIKWGCEAILEWRPTAPPRVPIHQVHGSDDKLIPLRLVRPNRIVRGGGHLVNMTHPADVNSFLASCMIFDHGSSYTLG